MGTGLGALELNQDLEQPRGTRGQPEAQLHLIATTDVAAARGAHLRVYPTHLASLSAFGKMSNW